MSRGFSRREALKLSGMAMLGMALGSPREVLAAEDDVPTVTLRANYSQGQWIFDPIGLYIEKGQKVRWVAKQWGGTVNAFHPSNYNHELRIPEDAKPFTSGTVPMMMTNWKGLNTFEWTFDVEGTYDYYSRDQENVGMVGRIIVGHPGGPGEKPPGYGAGSHRRVATGCGDEISAARGQCANSFKLRIPR